MQLWCKKKDKLQAASSKRMTVSDGQQAPAETVEVRFRGVAGLAEDYFFHKKYRNYKGLFYVRRPVILRVHLMYQGSFLCTTHYHSTVYYKGPSYVSHIRWTLIRQNIFHTKDPSYVNSLQIN